MYYFNVRPTSKYNQNYVEPLHIFVCCSNNNFWQQKYKVEADNAQHTIKREKNV